MASVLAGTFEVRDKFSLVVGWNIVVCFSEIFLQTEQKHLRQSGLDEMLTPKKTVSCFKYFPLVNNLSFRQKYLNIYFFHSGVVLTHTLMVY